MFPFIRFLVLFAVEQPAGIRSGRENANVPILGTFSGFRTNLFLLPITRPFWAFPLPIIYIRIL
jgi:hypothetical protein